MSETNIATDLCVDAEGEPWTPEIHKRVYGRASVPSVSGGYRSQGTSFENFPMIQAVAERARLRMVEVGRTLQREGSRR